MAAAAAFEAGDEQFWRILLWSVGRLLAEGAQVHGLGTL
jgi:hypothetical protein